MTPDYTAEEIQFALTEAQKLFLKKERKASIEKKLNQEREACKVVKEKIDHYTKTGNRTKLAIYKDKLEDHEKKILELEAELK